MSFLNEIRSRINSVKSTRQITSAMKMVASSKMRRAQDAIDRYYQYQQELYKILYDFMEYENRENISLTSQYSIPRKVNKVAIVAVSSNMSLCGSFNEDVYKEVVLTMNNYSSLGWKHVTLIPIGSKIAKKVSSYPDVYNAEFDKLINKVVFSDVSKLSEYLINKYDNGELDKIELIYHHHKSGTAQKIVHETYLPFSLEDIKPESISDVQDGEYINSQLSNYEVNYIFEPDAQSIMTALVPKLIRLKFYTMLLDSAASEQSARMVAMQIATDNADNLLQTLSVQYNKQRQQAITSELLDIVGGTIN